MLISGNLHLDTILWVTLPTFVLPTEIVPNKATAVLTVAPLRATNFSAVSELISLIELIG